MPRTNLLIITDGHIASRTKESICAYMCDFYDTKTCLFCNALLNGLVYAI